MISSVLMERRGRRFAHLVSCVPSNIGWFIIATSKEVPTLIAGRFLQGFSMGLSAPLSSVLIGEYTSPKNRGPFLAIISISVSLGILAVQTIGCFLSWRHTALMSSTFTFIGFIMVTFSPETPSWLASKGRYEESGQAFMLLRGEQEYPELEAMIEARKTEKVDSVKCNETNESRVVQLMKILKKKEFLKPITVVIHLYCMLQFSGMFVFTAYMVDILHSIMGSRVNAYFWMITLDVVRLLGNCFAMFLMRALKRRHLLMCTGSLCVLSLLSISSYCFLNARYRFDIVWIPVVLVNMYIISMSTGVSVMPFTIAGEVFPVAYRSLGSGISVIVMAAGNFASVKTAPTLLADMGITGTFCVYAGIVGYCLIVVLLLLPETKDRTLQEIEDEFRGHKLQKRETTTLQPLHDEYVEDNYNRN